MVKILPRDVVRFSWDDVLRPLGPSTRLGVPVLVVLALVVVLLSTTVVIGADAMWLVTVGRWIARHGTIPDGVPFAAADTSDWVNVPVLGELVFAAADWFGDGGLLALHLVLVVLTLVALATAARRLGAGDGATALAVLLVVAGSLPAFGVVRAQSLSLLFFTLLTALLRAQHLRPNKGVWLGIPLLILWGNLHGAVLVGMAVAGSYLLFSRMRDRWREATGVGLAVLVSLWFTPGGIRTHEYYLGVLMNAAARRGEGLWAPLNVTATFDALLILCALVIVGLAIARRLPLWEYFALAGLIGMTFSSSRHGIWLLLFAAPRAAPHLSVLVARRGMMSAHRRGRSLCRRSTTLVGAVLALVALAWPGVAHQAAEVRAQRVTAKTLAQTIGPLRSTVAPSPLAEWLASEGVLLWAGNPIDAFPQGRQSGYLDFLASPGERVSQLNPTPAAAVLPQASEGSSSLRAGHFRLVARLAGYTVFLVWDVGEAAPGGAHPLIP